MTTGHHGYCADDGASRASGFPTELYQDFRVWGRKPVLYYLAPLVWGCQKTCIGGFGIICRPRLPGVKVYLVLCVVSPLQVVTNGNRLSSAPLSCRTSSFSLIFLVALSTWSWHPGTRHGWVCPPTFPNVCLDPLCWNRYCECEVSGCMDV